MTDYDLMILSVFTLRSREQGKGARPHMEHKLQFIVVRVRYTCEVPVRVRSRHDLQTHVSVSHRRHRRY